LKNSLILHRYRGLPLHFYLCKVQGGRALEFRRSGVFVGSGVVEAGCKTVAHQRLKHSGMRWTVKGAEAILALRCREASGRWDEFWTLPHAQTQREIA
jgi:hypothetical protein